MNTLRSLVTIFVTIWGSIFLSRSKRNVMGAVLAVLCVAVFVAGALLVQKQGLATDTKQRSRANEHGRLHAPQSSARSDRGSTISPAEEDPASAQSDAQQSRMASSDDNSQSKTRASEQEPGQRTARLVAPEPPPVFSVMKNADVRKKLSDATKPRGSDAELAGADARTTGEQLAEASRGISVADDQKEARERKERAAKRELASSENERVGLLATGAEVSTPARDKQATPAGNGESKTSSGRRMSRRGGAYEPGRVVPQEGQASEGIAVNSGPEAVQLVGPVSQDEDLRKLPYIAPTESEEEETRLKRHPDLNGPAGVSDPFLPYSAPSFPPSMPSPIQTFGGITSAQSGCGCLPPDTNGDVGPNHYIQSVNSSVKIFDKVGNPLNGTNGTTYNSFFSALGVTTPCGNNQNQGDGVVFYDHLANRWVVTDFAFPAFPGALFYECVGVSKTADPVAGGWWLYALQVDSSNPTFLGDYPKFGLWPDAYYFSTNLFSNNTTFNGVRVFALNRSAMINGTGAPNPGAVAFTITPANLGDKYSLVPASFRTGASPPVGRPEYFMAINSSATAGTVETQVFAYRFHVDFVTPANSTFGVGASHTPDGTVTVNGFVDAFTATAGTAIVPQTGTASLLDTLGDKLMMPLVYQNLGGTESLWASHTINNNQGGTGPTAIRWYQFNITGNTIPATPAQQQTFNNGGDGLWRFMPSIAVDSQGNTSIGYSASSSSTNPAIKYAGRLAADTPSTLAQGEALLIQGAGHQTSASGRWGDYSALSIDPSDNCTFWHTNEYFSATSSASWNTRIGSFKFATCGACSTITGTVSGGGTICNGSSSTVSVDVTGGTPPYTVKLTNNAQVQTGSAVQTHFDFTVSPTTTTNYQIDTASSHDNGSCPLSNSGSGTVTVNQPPTPATVGGNQTICALGTTAGLGGNTPSSGTGTWTVVSGGTGTFGNIHTGNTTFAHTTGTGPVVLRWTISNSPCTDSTAQVTITVNQQPTPATVGSNQTICALGTTTGLGGNTPGVGTGTWTVVSGGTGTFGNIHTGNTTFTHASGAGPVVVKWTIANAPCTDSTAQLTITITPQPTATTGGNKAVCVNGTTAGLGGNTPPIGGTGTWSVVSGGSGTFSNANTPNATFMHTGGTGPVVVRWTVTNPPCTNATADASITINQPPAAPTITPAPASVCAGSTGNTASAPVSSGYMWSISNGVITSATNIQAITYIAGASGNVTLNLTVTNAAGCSANNSLMVMIKPIGLDKDHLSVPGNGGTGTVNVTPSDLTCAWTANTSASFIHITSGSAGVGTGSVQFTVDANPSSSIRSDTILIGGQTFTVYQGIDFVDVPPTDQFYSEIGKLSARGITLGCNPVGPLYCPNDPVLREQMSAFLMRALGEFNPPTPASQRFGDVPPSNQFYNFIERLAVLGITLGCQPGMPPLYCPTDGVKREQMSAFILRALGEFNPPIPAMQRFGDVPPANDFYAFIDRLAVLGITNGCQPGNPPLFCPGDNVTRGQMAAFLVRAFNL